MMVIQIRRKEALELEALLCEVFMMWPTNEDPGVCEYY